MSTTTKALAGELEISPKALRNRLKRAGIEIASINQVLPNELVEYIRDGKELKSYEGPHPAIKAEIEKPKVTRANTIAVNKKKWEELQSEIEQLNKELGSFKKLAAESKEYINHLIEEKSELREIINTKNKELEEEKNRIANGATELSNEFQLKWDALKKEHQNQVDKLNNQIKGLQKAIKAQINDNPIKNRWMATTATALIAIPASFCVYFFAKEFVPHYIAVIEGASLETTYIGLAILVGLNKEQRKMAGYIGGFAMFIGMIYCTLAAALHLNPKLLDGITGGWFWLVCALYGVPLPLLGYVVSGFLYKN